MIAADFLAAIQSRGSDARDIRDAAHETTHALQCNLHGPWERERIHAALERRARHIGGRSMFMSPMFRFELQARAIEMLACEQFGVEYDAKNWAMWCAMETAKTYRVDVGDLDQLAEMFVVVSKQQKTIELFDRVLAIKPKRARKAA